MKSPREFAERYMQKEFYLPFMSNMSGLLYLPDVPTVSEFEMIYKKSCKNRRQNLHKTTLNSLEHEKVGSDIREKISIALFELTQAMILDIHILKRLNKDFIKKRKDTIRYLEKILGNPFIEKRQVIVEELERLKAFGKNSKPYKEIDFISSWQHLFYNGLLKKLVLKVEARKLSEMLSMPMNFKKGRPQRFFSEVLQTVVFRYLHEHAKLPKEKARCLTKEIINEYIDGDRLLLGLYKSGNQETIRNAQHTYELQERETAEILFRSLADCRFQIFAWTCKVTQRKSKISYKRNY